MAKRWSVTSLVALALLGCLVGTEVEAQDSRWQKPVPSMAKGAPPPQAQQELSHPQMPQVQPPQQMAPQDPQWSQVQPSTQQVAPQYPQRPQVQHPTQQKAPQYPQWPQVQPPPQQIAPQYPQRPQVQPPPQQIAPQYPQRPQVQPPPQQIAPQYPQRPQIQPPPPQKDLQYPQMPPVQPPSQHKAPQYPQMPPVQPPPQHKAPQYPQIPPVQPPTQHKAPQYPQRPQVQPPTQHKAPQYPQYPQRPQVPPPTQQKAPQYPQRPQVQPPTTQHKAPQYPQYPQRPQVQPPTTQQKAPQYPQRPQVQPPTTQQKVPQYPQRPQVQLPTTQQKVPQYPQRPQVQLPTTQQKVPQYPQRPQVQPLPPQDPQSLKYSAYPRSFPNFQSPGEQQVSKTEQPMDPYQPQQPKQLQQPNQHSVPQTPSIYQPSVPLQPSFQSCEVAVSQKVPCGSADISAAGCEAISCCFNGQQCYFGKAVTVQCTMDAQFIVVVARDATLPNIDLESISLLGQGQGCTHVDSNSGFAIYNFPVTSCGSLVMEEPGVIIYENRMSASYEVGVGPLGVITRDSHFELLFQCRYTGTSVETVVAEVLPLLDPPLPVAAMGPISVHLRLANGQCNSKGCNEVDMAYSSFYTEDMYPVTKILREAVYVEVELLGKTDPNLVLTLDRCWVTTSPIPHNLPQWDILIDGCPYSDDRYLSSLVSVGPSSGLDFPSHYRRFLFKMFTFVDPNSMVPLKEELYIHCSTVVCSPVPGYSCEPSCFRKRRAVMDERQRTTEPKVVASVGPVNMSASAE